MSSREPRPACAKCGAFMKVTRVDRMMVARCGRCGAEVSTAAAPDPADDDAGARFVHIAAALGPNGDEMIVATDAAGRAWRCIDGGVLAGWRQLPAHPLSAAGKEEARGQAAARSSGLADLVAETERQCTACGGSDSSQSKSMLGACRCADGGVWR